MKKTHLSGIGLALVIAVALLGPRVNMDISLDKVILPNNLDLYLSESESRFDDITQGTEKVIMWAGTPGEKTAISIVSFHGFSATRQELSPLADTVAKSLNANLFYTRIAGHGRGADGMVDGSVNGWANDANEALEIGRRLGNKVILIGTSTGSTLATWLALQSTNTDLSAMILLSPNFYSADSNMSMLLWPWGQHIAEALIGKVRHWESKNPLHEKYWANDYATSSILPLMGLLKIVNDADIENINTPTQMIYSSKDKTISVPAVIDTFARLGSEQKELVEFNATEDPDFHALAGDLMSPTSTEILAGKITIFINNTLN
ncbi:MAG: alpha-beta hydrolase superfamily lysophospholipase [Porticoccaceae bacterium]|jgi:alpha-beta hydrolase superfamily lysophospholipase|tara:strand:+ start:3631 stop:4590 length:960 start_codon:yes stop_codon:yes gene_type:complete